MPMHRKNSSRRAAGEAANYSQGWFMKNKERQRNRKKMAKASKRKNRK
jgi:hypothetical protein